MEAEITKDDVEEAMGIIKDKENSSEDELADALSTLKELIELREKPGQNDLVGVHGNIEVKVFDEDGNEKGYRKIEF